MSCATVYCVQIHGRCEVFDYLNDAARCFSLLTASLNCFIGYEYMSAKDVIDEMNKYGSIRCGVISISKIQV